MSPLSQQTAEEPAPAEEVMEDTTEAAEDAPDGLRLVRVGTLDEAVGALTTLDTGGTPAGCS